MATKKRTSKAKPKSSAGEPSKEAVPQGKQAPRLYTLEVFLVSGLITEKFAKKNPVVSRTIQIRGDQTLEDLHSAIFDAYDRFDEHMYEFQFGTRAMDPKGPRYVLPAADEADLDDGHPPAGRVDQTTIDSLDLKIDRVFGYWFDFGDDWWHQVNVIGIDESIPAGKYPKITKREGKSPPQYLSEEDEL